MCYQVQGLLVELSGMFGIDGFFDGFAYSAFGSGG
jgi:hypothetical protein